MTAEARSKAAVRRCHLERGFTRDGLGRIGILRICEVNQKEICGNICFCVYGSQEHHQALVPISLLGPGELHAYLV